MKKIVLVLLAMAVLMGLTIEGWAQGLEIRQDVLISIDNYRLAKIRKSDFHVLWSADILMDSGMPEVLYQNTGWYDHEVDANTGNVFVIWTSWQPNWLPPPISLIMKYRGTDGHLLWKRVFEDTDMLNIKIDVYGRIFLHENKSVYSSCQPNPDLYCSCDVYPDGCWGENNLVERLRQDGTTYGVYTLPSGSSYQPPPQPQ